MKIAAHVLAYNVTGFLEAVIMNLDPQVDKIYIAHSEKPWGYVESSRLNATNPTSLDDVKRLTSFSNKVEIICGDWLTEEAMRNACLIKARAEGFDWFIIQDADEFYSEHSWNQIKKIFVENKSHDLFITTWYNFWKSPQYVLTHANDSIKGTNAGFAIRCESKVEFVRKRISNAINVKVIDCPCYHYGYVMTDEQMTDKLSTWGHAQEFDRHLWYKYKWEYWNESTVNLHPTNPSYWKRAIRFPLEQPDFAQQFDLPLVNEKKISGLDLLGKNYYEALINVNITKKSAKQFIKKVIK